MSSEPVHFRGRIYENLMETIGATPVVRLAKLAKSEGVGAELLGKCEFFNPLASRSEERRVGKEC